MNRLPVITLWQPWASWIVMGWKSIETRTHPRFAALCGQRIGIHAGVKWDNDALMVAGRYLTHWQIERTMDFLKIGGALVATAFVREHRALTGADSPLALIDCGNTQRFGLILEDVQIIEAIPMKGHQGVWYFPPPAPAEQTRGVEG